MIENTWRDKVLPFSCAWPATFDATMRCAQQAIHDQVAGDFVECGVFAGAQAAAMAYHLRIEDGRKVHLFDTFTGIPAGGEYDTNWPHPEGTSCQSLKNVQDNMHAWGIDRRMLVYHEGLFRDTVPKAIAENAFPNGIAVLRLDGDLYESTKDCMPLIALVRHGGWIMVDDFDLPGCRKAFLEAAISTGPIYFRKV